MTPLSSLGKLVVTAGVILVIFGLVLVFYDRIPFLGKLPGDIIVKRRNFTLHFPIVTSILLSIIVTIILNLISRK
jgi:hypothetical protein